MKTEVWFKKRRIKKDYRAVKIEYALNPVQQETIRSFFRYLVILHDQGCAVTHVITAFRKSCMSNERCVKS